MIKLSEEDLRRMLEAARTSGLTIPEDARRCVPRGEQAEFYRGFVSGIACVLVLSRSFLAQLDGGVDSGAQDAAEVAAYKQMIGEAVELITMRTVAPAAVAAELYLNVSGQNR